MIRSAVLLPPRRDATALATIASGMTAVSALADNAIERSNPTSVWNRPTTRSTNRGRSQNVSVRTTRRRSTSMDKGLEDDESGADERDGGRLHEGGDHARARQARARVAVDADQAQPGPLGDRERGLTLEGIRRGQEE